MLSLAGAPAQAADECGGLNPATAAGRTIECTKDNYKPKAEQKGYDNIFYEISDTDGNYTFEIKEGVVIKGRRSNKGQARDTNVPFEERRPSEYPITNERNTVVLNANEADTVIYDSDTVGDDGDGNGNKQDDHGRRGYKVNDALGNPKAPVSGRPPRTRYGGIFIDTGVEFDGSIKLRSQADITVDHEPFSTDDPDLREGRREGLSGSDYATGISVRHYGRSGDLDLDIGGRIKSVGAAIRAEIDSRFDGKNEDGQFQDYQFKGDITIDLLAGLSIRTSGEDGNGVEATHHGSGHITITARESALSADPDIQTSGHDASGIQVRMGNRWDAFANELERDISIILSNYHIKTTGGYVPGATRQGNFEADPKSSRDASFEGSRGLKVYHNTKGTMKIDLTGSRIETQGVRGQGIYGVYFADGKVERDGMLRNYSPLPKNSAGGGDMNIDLRNSQIVTRGNYADAIFGYHSSKGDVNIEVMSGSEITTAGANAHGIAGLHHGTGDVLIDFSRSRITTAGAGSDGIRGGHRGAGKIEIKAHNAAIQTQGAKADGIFAFHLGTDGTVDLTKYDQEEPVSAAIGTGPYELFEAVPEEPFPAASGETEIKIDVEGGSIAACDDEETEDREDCEGRGIAAEFGPAVQDGHAQVDIARAVVKGDYAVQFKGGRGTLNLTDSRLVGNVLFARGGYNDMLKIEQKARSGRIDGNIEFSPDAPGDNDQMTLDIARGQHFGFNGWIGGLETMTQRGGGWARFAEDVLFSGDSRLRLEDGYLVIAGMLNLGNGVLTVKDAGRLVFEAGQDSEGRLKHGHIRAGTLHFADVQQGSPAVALLLSENLSDKEAGEVRRQLADQANRTEGLVLITIQSVTRGSDSEPVTNLVLRPDPDGAVRVGTIEAATGRVTFDSDAADRLGRLRLPGTIITASSSTGRSASSATGSGGGSGSGILGLGLLAVLLASFGADEEAEASFAGYGSGAAYAAAASERGGGPDRMWMRTGGQSLPMTGVAQAGVSGAAAGLSLHEGDHFYLGISAAPAVTARVDSLDLAARGAVHSLRAGWRAERWFAGLRLAQGDFRVAAAVANPATGGALASRFALRSAQAQLRAGLHLDAGALRFTPSAAVQAGRLAHSAHVAESPALRARVPAFSQDYTGWQLGLRMSASRWLDAAGGGRWQPQLQFQTIRTSAAGGAVGLRQADRLGALSFNTPAGLRALPKAVHSLRLGARVRPAGHRGIWKLGLAGLEAGGEAGYAALAAYQLRF